MEVVARQGSPISPHCYVYISFQGLREEHLVWVEAPPMAFPLLEQEAKARAWAKVKRNRTIDLTECSAPPS
eukprot:459736-Pyramimonas_sp.AAC.1